MDEDLDSFRVDEGYCKACLDIQGGREQRVYRFPNGYGASLISLPKLGGARLWIVVALLFIGDEYESVELPGMTNGITLDWERSMDALSIIKDHPHF
ncbi:MAG: hypothetical protein E4H30_07595 [Methanomassiliicoccus sp.]|nr:MAG: hypothetical protein E4H30_07595 [Methanomassiliicoccus sp.]